MILAGDIGGTNTRLAFFEGNTMIVEQKFRSKNYQSLEEIIHVFLEQQKKEFSSACFGVAGPVVNGKCIATNLPWVIDVANLRSVCKISSVSLLNDLETKSYGIRVLRKDELYVLQEGKKQSGNQALIAAGTGLGEAGLYWDGKDHHPFACEGGHTDFAPRNDLEIELLIYLQKKYQHVSYERVVSGPGIPLLYQFLIETGKEIHSKEIENAMKVKDAPFVIAEWALKHQDPACLRTIHWFLSLYGAETGNLALKFLSLGGIYIGGGIAPSMIQQMRDGEFLSSFRSKGRFQELLESIPVFVILNDDASLLGAAYYASKAIV
ncbi:MAG TPA: glucokinase [Chlamydiales bacterium]|nr:glucokinase [Chlamydiales bacterium]